jgi:hypothetical protein
MEETTPVPPALDPVRGELTKVAALLKTITEPLEPLTDAQIMNRVYCRFGPIASVFPDAQWIEFVKSIEDSVRSSGDG